MTLPKTAAAILDLLAANNGEIAYHGASERPGFTLQGLTALRHRGLALVTHRTPGNPPRIGLTDKGREEVAARKAK